MKIRLKEDLVMTTDYAGRGNSTKGKIFPKGTTAIYTKQETLSGIYHTCSVIENGIKWQATKKEETE